MGCAREMGSEERERDGENGEAVEGERERVKEERGKHTHLRT